MSNWLVIDGVQPWDGRYELDLDRDWTRLEWRWIKQLAGYMPLTFDDGISGGDPDLFTVLAVIAMVRAGRIQAAEVPDVYKRFDDVPVGSSIQFESRAEEDAEPVDPSSPASSDVSESSSGESSTKSSGMWDSPRNPAGSQGSDTSESVPVTLAS